MSKILSFLGLSLILLIGFQTSITKAQSNCSAEESAFNKCAQQCWQNDSEGNLVNTCEPSEVCSTEVTAYNDCLSKPANSGPSAGEQALIDQANSVNSQPASANTVPNPGTGGNARYAPAFSDPTKPIFNGPGLIQGATYVEGRLDKGVSKERNLKELIIGWTNFLTSIAALMAVVALVWAGFLYVTALGDDSRMETAKKIVIWVVIGILLILAAYAIVNTVMRAVF